MSEKLGVVLLNLGGPDSLEAVEPFLYNLFSDPEIIDFPLSFLFRNRLAKLIASKRHPRVQEQYKEIGGRSPLKEHTLAQADLLEKRLNAVIPAKVYVAMRYWTPFTAEALDRIEADGITRVVLLPLYPQFSRATTASSFNEWNKHLSDRGLHETIKSESIESYHDHPAYVDSIIVRIKEKLEHFPDDRRESVHLLFSAHGTPMKLVRQGDPYSGQIVETVAAVMRQGEFELDHSLCYQSKVGPVKWLTPATPDKITELASKGVKDMLVVPVAFTSDHLETLFEIGVEYRRLAHKQGVEEFHVTEGLNDSEAFIEALAQLVFEKIGHGGNAAAAS